MTLWDLRQWVEQSVPVWAYAAFVTACLVGITITRVLRARAERRPK